MCRLVWLYTGGKRLIIFSFGRIRVKALERGDSILVNHKQTYLLLLVHLILILPKPKVISHCHQYRDRPACTSVQSIFFGYLFMVKHSETLAGGEDV